VLSGGGGDRRGGSDRAPSSRQHRALHPCRLILICDEYSHLAKPASKKSAITQLIRLQRQELRLWVISSLIVNTRSWDGVVPSRAFCGLEPCSSSPLRPRPPLLLLLILVLLVPRMIFKRLIPVARAHEEFGLFDQPRASCAVCRTRPAKMGGQAAPSAATEGFARTCGRTAARFARSFAPRRDRLLGRGPAGSWSQDRDQIWRRPRPTGQAHQSSTISSGTRRKSRRFLLSNIESVVRAILAMRRSSVPRRPHCFRSDLESSRAAASNGKTFISWKQRRIFSSSAYARRIYSSRRD
jgi:hypothetical protein